MSTLTGQPNLTEIQSEKELTGYFQSHAKSETRRLVGLEAEIFGVCSQTGRALPYLGPCGIQSVIQRFADKFSFELIKDEGFVIGAQSSHGTMIGLEPGGQVELSAPPVRTLFEVEKQLTDFLRQLCAFQCECREIYWISTGIHPFSRLDEIDWVPKARYKVLAEYMKTHGTLSHHMMKRTATNQFNFDYTGEDDAMEMLRTALSVTSIASALFANASFSEGRLNGRASERLHIWHHTSPERAGLLLPFVKPGKTFQDYLDYVLDTPMIFAVRKGRWIPMRGIPFRQYIRGGHEGLKAAWSDFELHLSTMFPEVRFKQYMEIRGTDAQHPFLIPSAAAFWKGLLYDRGARQAALKLTQHLNDAERLTLHADAAQKGLQAQFGKGTCLEAAKELVSIARRGLESQSQGKGSEAEFLDRIEERILKPGKSPGEQLAENWSREWGKNPKRLLENLAIQMPAG